MSLLFVLDKVSLLFDLDKLFALFSIFLISVFSSFIFEPEAFEKKI